MKADHGKTGYTMADWRAAIRPRNLLGAILAIILSGVITAPGAIADDDVIEFLAGSKIEGRVIKIDKDAKTVAFAAKFGVDTLTRVFPYGRIHAVTYQGKRYVLNPLPGPDGGAAKPTSGTTSPDGKPLGKADSKAPINSAGNPVDKPSARPVRSAAAIKTLIDEAGRTPASWFEESKLDYPATLDLSWPEKPEGGWNNQKNVGQYLWDVVNPNPSRWASGVRLVQYLLENHSSDPKRRNRTERVLGGMYFNLFQDYPRAAYWWQRAGVALGDPESVPLAECYFRLGNKKMAQELLVDPDRPRSDNRIYVGMVKLWGDMAEPAKAVKLAEMILKSGGEPQLAHLLAGDACRLGGQHANAIKHYQKAIDAPVTGKGKVDQMVRRARENLEAVKLFELSDVRRVKDGRHRASSLGYEGPIEVEVEVLSGRIEAVRVVRHAEKQFYSALTDVPRQIIDKQGVKGVDATSRATITAEAVINATAKALAENVR
ncbi:MAG: FMN-binding protein [Planctomycetota bacterium]